MDSDTTSVLYVEADSGTTLVFTGMRLDLTLKDLQGDFLDAAKPVLGISNISAAHYLNTTKTPLQ